MTQQLTAIVQKASRAHSATVFFFHGLGDSGSGWSPVGTQISREVPHVKFIFPNAPDKPITINGGAVMPAWYDIHALGDINNMMKSREDEQGLLASIAAANSLIREEIGSGIPSNRIVVGGFSQGGAMALAIGLTSEYPFAGIISLSGYIPCRKKILMMSTETNKKTPIFMGHGDWDMVVPHQFGKETSNLLQENGYSVNFKTYEGMGHSSDVEEIRNVTEFLKRVIPALN
ncbi:4735_t:CDS:2 [Ambispora gerdemannii]|uniref:Acyl-protein thioesterase 1 n=1 Tax=Ambispora gerdemannii TaxID=144530 RepID=A0A9N8YMS3_9GLOM|nr:4735_t:CDS:2 [Ambispora gerdemannii]